MCVEDVGISDIKEELIEAIKDELLSATYCTLENVAFELDIDIDEIKQEYVDSVNDYEAEREELSSYYYSSRI